MRKSGVKGLGRLLSVLMVAALLMTTAMVPALALDRWEDVVVSVIWTDSQGQQQTTQAFPVPDSAEHAYWATLDASALFSTVQVQVVSSDPAYTFYLKDYASEIMWTQDATALDPMYSYEVDYYCNSVYEGMFPLYLSSQGMPETPAQESVNVPVYYVTEDGQQLDFQYASCLTNATTQVYANSSVVPWDYLLVKPASGVMDVISTDHAPHGAEEKAQSMLKAPFGIVGLETSFALGFTELVQGGYLSLSQLVEKMSVNPARVLDIDKGNLAPGKIADLVIADVEHQYEIDSASFASKGKNTPFDGRKVTGRVVTTIVDGKIVYEEGRS